MANSSSLRFSGIGGGRNFGEDRFRTLILAISLASKQGISPNDQRQTQEVHAAKVLIILANVGGLKRQIPIDGHGRVRRDTPEIGKDGKEENKYIGPKGESALYYPPDTKTKLAARSDIFFVLVEAQKSVLALTAWADRMGIGDQILPIGMNGCWGWSKDKQPPRIGARLGS